MDMLPQFMLLLFTALASVSAGGGAGTSSAHLAALHLGYNWPTAGLAVEVSVLGSALLSWLTAGLAGEVNMLLPFLCPAPPTRLAQEVLPYFEDSASRPVSLLGSDYSSALLFWSTVILHLPLQFVLSSLVHHPVLLANGWPGKGGGSAENSLQLCPALLVFDHSASSSTVCPLPPGPSPCSPAQWLARQGRWVCWEQPVALPCSPGLQLAWWWSCCCSSVSTL